MSGCNCGCDDTAFGSGCACDHQRFPPPARIAAGLSRLPRQWAGFAEYRDHLLSLVRSRPALDAWRARDNDDLGLMVLDSWSYVLDVTGFYDAFVAGETYIRTATQPRSLRNLVALTGYRPRPAVAASVYLAAFADGADPVALPAGTGFRSKAVGADPPQLFELQRDTVIHPAHNSWTQAPERSSAFAGIFAFPQTSAGVAAGQIVLIRTSSTMHAARVSQVKSVRLEDAEQYRVASFTPAPPSLSGTALSAIDISVFGQSAAPTAFVPDQMSIIIAIPTMSPGSGSGSVIAPAVSEPPAFGSTFVVLDSLYTSIRPNDPAIIETTGGVLKPVIVTDAKAVPVILSDPVSTKVTTKVTQIRFASIGNSGDVARVHFRATPAGALVNPGRTSFSPAELIGPHALQGPVRMPSGTPAPVALIANGEGNGGARYDGTVAAGQHGAASATATALVDAAADSLTTPIAWHGNVLRATRGQTVFNEVLGSGNSAAAYQTFRLRKKPLTYLPSPAADTGVAPELEVRVGGILWRRIETFLTAGPDDHVYIVRHDDEGETDIIFGDLCRPTTGNANITATYRFGAGAASPPPGSIGQIAKRTAGLSKVLQPLECAGGADAEAADAVRVNAPVKMMTMGRAVSISDYTVFARGFTGIVNAAAAWAWDGVYQQATVKIWVISAGASLAVELAGYLQQLGDANVAISVTEATDVGATLAVSIDVAAGYDRPLVAAAVEARLTDPKAGLFAAANAAIGVPLYRSVIVAAVMGVDGVAAVRSLSVNGQPVDTAIAVQPGCYLAFETVVVG
ncbi:hypothetical protein [Mesorhizobium sp. IMUNJ 23232]|uniref:hypothetical protein n=1 Tax=Mesorhizobium sp. IMUNJ 23232 TaxID=3376064 RepID=UPI00378C241E